MKTKNNIGDYLAHTIHYKHTISLVYAGNDIWSFDLGGKPITITTDQLRALGYFIIGKVKGEANDGKAE